MYILLFLHTISWIVNLCLSLYIFTRDPKSLLNRVCSSLLFFFAVWSFCNIFMRNSDLPIEISEIFYQISAFSWMGSEGVFAVLVLIFIQKINSIKKIYLYPVLIIPPLFFIGQQWLGDLFIKFEKHYFWGNINNWQVSASSILFLIYISLVIAVPSYMLLSYSLKTGNQRKKRLGIIIFSTTLVSFALSFFSDVIAPLMKFNLIPPVGDIFLSIWGLGIVYSMVKYRFLEITPGIAADKIVSTIPDFLLLLDRDGKISSVNKKVLDRLMFEEDELTGQHVDFLLGKGKTESEFYAMIIGKEDVHNLPLFLKTKMGREVPVNFSRSALKDKNGETIGNVCVASDMTEYKEVENNLKEGRKFYRTLVDTSPDIIFNLSVDGTIKALNPAFEKMTGWPPDKWTGESFISLLHPGDHSVVTEKIGIINQGCAAQPFEIRIISESGESLYQELIIIPEYMDGVLSGIFGFAHDITKRKKYEDQLKYLAFHDALTDLPNRKSFLTHLDEELMQVQKKGSQGAVFYVDLDHFKQINDSYGHDIGDWLLQEVSYRLSGSIRENDQAYRIGGDEFLILLRDIETDTATGVVAENIMKAISEPCSISEHTFYISPSIGISMFPKDASDSETLLKYADDAMYYAKETGKNSIQLYNEDIKIKSKEKITIRNDLNEAIKEKQLSLMFQPIIKDLKIIGTEALLSWDHPQKGLIDNSTYIPVAEESGLIHKIGEWVILEACRRNKEWNDLGFNDIYISINISAKQFKKENLINLIDQSIGLTGLNPELLNLEITESCVVEDLDKAIEKMHALRRRGIKIAIDDFGTGFSSLSSIKKFPVNTLKIDKSFTSNIVNDPKDQSIVRATIDMAKGLGLEVITEGVETLEQLNLMSDMGCRIYQGFYFHRPESADNIKNLLENSR